MRSGPEAYPNLWPSGLLRLGSALLEFGVYGFSGYAHAAAAQQ